MEYKFEISGFSDEIDNSIDKQFSALNELGINFFEVRGVNGKNISVLDDCELETLKQKMNEYNIKASSIGSPIGKIKITDDFEPHFEEFKRIVHIAKYLGTKYIRIFSFYYPKNEEPEKYRNEVFSRLNKMCKYAEDNDVILLHENEKDIYGDIARRCKDIFDNIKSPNFKAVFDVANFIQSGEKNIPEVFDMLENNVVYVHIKDADSEGNIVPAGYGNGKYEYIIEKLKSKGYHGFLSLEPHLGSFSGLENLELDDKMTKLEKSDISKFKLAYESLKKIL